MDGSSPPPTLTQLTRTKLAYADSVRALKRHGSNPLALDDELKSYFAVRSTLLHAYTKLCSGNLPQYELQATQAFAAQLLPNTTRGRSLSLLDKMRFHEPEVLLKIEDADVMHRIVDDDGLVQQQAPRASRFDAAESSPLLHLDLVLDLAARSRAARQLERAAVLAAVECGELSSSAAELALFGCSDGGLLDLPTDALESVVDFLDASSLGALAVTSTRSHANLVARASEVQAKHAVGSLQELHDAAEDLEDRFEHGRTRSAVRRKLLSVTTHAGGSALRLDLGQRQLQAARNGLSGAFRTADSRAGAHVRACRGLRKLELVKHEHALRDAFAARLTNKVAGAAASHTLLRELRLPGDELSLDACRTLGRALARDNCSLTSLDLTSSSKVDEAKLDDYAALALADGLGANTSLRSLCLAHNRVGKEGAKALGQKLARQNRTLTLLDVRANGLDSHGLQSLAAAMVSNAKHGGQLRRLRACGCLSTKQVRSVLEEARAAVRAESSSNLVPEIRPHVEHEHEVQCDDSAREILVDAHGMTHGQGLTHEACVGCV